MKTLRWPTLLRKILLSSLALLWVGSGLGFCQAPGYPKAILPGDYPDPSILRDGADYYMTHSPFYYSPGFLIWHSKDLEHWEPVARAMTRVVGSAMAPDLVKHAGKYYLYFPAAGANWVISADNIRGPWSEPVRLNVSGIDPGHAVGEDGKRYLFLSGGSRIGLSPDGLSVSGTKEQVYSGWDYPSDWNTEGKFLESPKIIHKGEYYYLISAEGGTAGPATSHMVIAARSKSINGPWENSPYNPIVHTYSAEEPWWSKGHGTLIDDVKGNWWIVYHAYKNGCYPLGRQTLIEPIEWLKDGWFRVANSATPLPAQADKGNGIDTGKLLSDNFAGTELGLQWTAWQEFDPKSVRLENQSLYLGAKGSGPQDGRLLLVTAGDCSYEVQTEITLGSGNAGGLVLFYNEKAFAGISSDGLQFTLYKNARQAIQSPNSFGRHFFLKIRNQKNACLLQVSGDGKNWETLDSAVDVSPMHHNNYRGFLALRPGLMALGKGEVQFKEFKYRPLAGDGRAVAENSESKPHDAGPQPIHPGEVWNDNRGKPIQAHGGGILKQGDTFYWFGEDRSKENDPEKRYVACYSSTDLAHWTFRNQVIQLADPEGFGPKWVLERPKVYFNAKTRKYVMYMHIDGPEQKLGHNYGLARVGVAVSDTVDGHYKYLRSFRPLSQESRDIGQFVDDDGSAYLLFESRPTKGFYIARLSGDYLDVEKVESFVEAPLESGALVHYNGLYYCVGSHMTGWDPNPNVYATAKSLSGPWTRFKDLAPRETKTYGAQSTFLLKVVGSRQSSVIFMGDIWKPKTLWDSRYLWMPLEIGEGKMRLPTPRPWTIDVSTGEAK